MTENKERALVAITKTVAEMTGQNPIAVAIIINATRHVIDAGIHDGRISRPDIAPHLMAALFPDEYTCEFSGDDIHLIKSHIAEKVGNDG